MIFDLIISYPKEKYTDNSFAFLGEKVLYFQERREIHGKNLSGNK